MDIERIRKRIEGLGGEAKLVAGRGVDLGTLPAVLASAYGDRPAIAAFAGHDAAPDSPGLPARAVRSYQDLEDDVARLAAAHESLGNAHGARVAIAVSNRVDVLLHVFALVRAGALPVPVNPRLKPAEFVEVVRASDASVVLADRDLAAGFAPSGQASVTLGPQAAPNPGPAERAPGGARWCWAREDVAAWLDEHPGARLGPTQRVPSGETALLLCTSGTTGHPKVAALTSEGLLRAGRLLVLAPVGRDRGLRAGRDALICALPLAHVMGVGVFLGALCAGTKIIHHERFHARDVLDAIEAERPNVFIGVPTMYADLEASGAAHYDLSSVQVWISAADVMPEARARRFQGYGAAGHAFGKAFGTALFLDIYGMVELSGAAAVRVFPASPIKSRELPAFSFMLPGFEARVVDEEGRPMRWGSTGALQMRGDSVLRKYEGAPGAGPLPGGWFPTGDLARVWPGGLYTFMGRSKDRLKVGGFSVFPAEVETLLREHADVAEVVLVGVPDERLGERPVALVVPHRRPFDAEAFVGWAADKVAGYRRPREALVADALPRGHNGKIDRAAATRLAIAQLGAA